MVPLYVDFNSCVFKKRNENKIGGEKSIFFPNLAQ
jgi:hypothetical protein